MFVIQPSFKMALFDQGDTGKKEHEGDGNRPGQGPPELRSGGNGKYGKPPPGRNFSKIIGVTAIMPEPGGDGPPFIFRVITKIT